MSDWITADDAKALTGVQTIDDAALDAAEVDVYDLIRWNPVFGVDLADGSDRSLRQVSALSRAIAWQAAYRIQNPPSVAWEPEVSSESVSTSSYSVSYAEGGGAGSKPTYAKRVRELVANAGLMRLTGISDRGRTTDDDRIIPVIW